MWRDFGGGEGRPSFLKKEEENFYFPMGVDREACIVRRVS